jgi:transcriptional regulator with XRE-family HTH domain
MNIDELIDAAKRKKGSMSAVAEGLQMNQTRLSDWRAGRRKPDANEIAYLADSAGLPVFETVGMIQMQLDNRFSTIWQAALKKLQHVDNADNWRKR